jgi:hypothetical protein
MESNSQSCIYDFCSIKANVNTLISHSLYKTKGSHLGNKD